MTSRQAVAIGSGVFLLVAILAISGLVAMPEQNMSQSALAVRGGQAAGETSVLPRGTSSHSASTDSSVVMLAADRVEELDFSELMSISASDNLRIRGAGGFDDEFQIASVRPNARNVSVRGSSTSAPDSSLLLTVSPKGVYGSLRVAEQIYAIDTMADGQVVMKLEDTSRPIHVANDVIHSEVPEARP